MKKLVGAFIGICVLAAIVVGIFFVKKQNAVHVTAIPQKSSDAADTMNKENSDSKNVISLMTNLQGAGYAGGRQCGYLGDLLASKLRVEVTWDFETGLIEYYGQKPDMWQWRKDGGYDDYCEYVKKGKLVNLEDEINAHPEVYKKYKKVIAAIKEKTYKLTGKKGIYSFPMSLQSFDDTDIKRCIGDSVSILADSKHKDKALALLTYAASDEGIMNFVYGPENENWEVKDGKYKVLHDWTEDADAAVDTINEDQTAMDYSGRPVISLVGNATLAKCLVKESNQTK